MDKPYKKLPVVSGLRIDHGYIPPQAIEIEIAVLGAIILENNAILRILSILKPQVFYKEAHVKICTAILRLNDHDKPIDLLTVYEELIKMGEAESVGGAYYLGQLTNRVASTANIQYHYAILLEKYFRREFIRIGDEGARQSYDEGIDVFEIYEWFEKQLNLVDIHIRSGSFSDAKNVFERTMELIQGEKISNTYFPIDDKGVDKTLMLSPGNLLNISGKSGSGKTTFIIYLVRQLTKRYKNEMAICWYSMEDPATKILLGYISPDMKLTHNQMMGKNYNLSKSEIEQIQIHGGEFLKNDIEFFEKPALMSQIKSHFQTFCSNRPNKFNILIIDNIMMLRENQEMRFKNKSVDVDDHIASQIQGLFADLKEEYKINVWYAHHLTKEQLTRGNAVDGYRPREGNIKGSTRLRDIATQGVLVHRPGEFADIVKHYKDTEYEEPVKYLVVCETYKNRDGRLGFFRYFASLDYKIFYPI